MPHFFRVVVEIKSDDSHAKETEMPKVIDPLDELITIPEAAQQLRLSEREVRAFLADGALRGTKVGGRWFTTSSAVADFGDELDEADELDDDDGLDDDDDDADLECDDDEAEDEAEDDLD